jgi:hypothetical protein
MSQVLTAEGLILVDSFQQIFFGDNLKSSFVS